MKRCCENFGVGTETQILPSSPRNITKAEETLAMVDTDDDSGA